LEVGASSDAGVRLATPTQSQQVLEPTAPCIAKFCLRSNGEFEQLPASTLSGRHNASPCIRLTARHVEVNREESLPRQCTMSGPMKLSICRKPRGHTQVDTHRNPLIPSQSQERRTDHRIRRLSRKAPTGYLSDPALAAQYRAHRLTIRLASFSLSGESEVQLLGALLGPRN
jgi:hypothetical protein